MVETQCFESLKSNLKKRICKIETLKACIMCYKKFQISANILYLKEGCNCEEGKLEYKMFARI